MRYHLDMTTDPELKRRLTAAFAWRGDRGTESMYADVSGWFRDPVLLEDLARGLANLHRAGGPTVVLGLESSGFLLGTLVARELRVGFVAVRKDPERVADSDPWLLATTPPDYQDRHLTLGFRPRLLSPRDHMLLVDDWIATGGQASAVRALVEQAEARWLGAAVVVDALTSNEVRRRLVVRALLNVRDI